MTPPDENPSDRLAREALETAKPADPPAPHVQLELALPPPPKAPTCPNPACGQPVSLTEHGAIRPHFARVTDARVCPRSYQPLVPKAPAVPKP
jgi:hypothetical protein